MFAEAPIEATSTAGPLPGSGLSRRAALGACLAVLSPAGSDVMAQPAAATTWPTNRPVRIIVPVAAGGTSDFMARSLAQRLQEATGGLSFVVENRTGGGGAIAWQAAARGAPDGTILAVVDNALPIAMALGRDLGFDPTMDLEPLSPIADFAPVVVVNSALPVRTLGEFVAYARARPGELFYGSNGTGGITHLQTELLQDVAGLRMTHVSYRGNAQAAADVVSGRLHVLVAVVPTVVGQLRSGGLRAIAVGTAEGRIGAVPEVPSAREQGFDFANSVWFGLMAPRGTPPATVGAMHMAVAAAMAPPEFRQRVEENGGRVAADTPAAFRQFVSDDAATWSRVIREKNIKLE